MQERSRALNKVSEAEVVVEIESVIVVVVPYRCKYVVASNCFA